MRVSLVALLLAVLVAACTGNPATPAPATPVPASPTASPVPTLAPTPDPTATPGSTYLPLPTDTPLPTPSATPSATPSGPFSMDVYRKGAFVSEYKKYWCLPAAMQVMINIMADGRPDTSYAMQEHLYNLIRTFVVPPYDQGRGGDPIGWAKGLNAEGYGPYRVAIRPTMEEAIKLAAKQQRLTNKPVGLVVWRGAHSWSMSGFKSDVDPLTTDTFNVLGIYAEDVWYPRISSIWGPSFEPDSFDPYDQIHIDYKHYRRPGEVHPDMDGQWVLVVPVLPGQKV